MSVVEEQPAPAWDLRDLAVIAGLYLPALVLGTLVWLWAPSKVVRLVAAQLTAWAVWLFAAGALLRMRCGLGLLEAARAKLPVARLGLWTALGPVMAGVFLAAAWLMDMPRIETPMRDLLAEPGGFWLLAFAGSTAGPWCEEIAFRGLVQPVLAARLGTALGIAATSLPFALMHGPEYAWSWRHLALLVAVSASFGVVRAASGSTLASAAAHAGYNTTQFVLLYLAGEAV
ncbi:MAG: CPBP family intramembrane metalloprotease [Acidobacteria bacterium]|nr:CPBP family intramembrane metalloprotease [Acidobacteriota bacterium]